MIQDPIPKQICSSLGRKAYAAWMLASKRNLSEIIDPSHAVLTVGHNYTP